MIFDWYIYLVLPLIGFLGMFCGGYWSVGCGWLIVPTMLIFGFTPNEAVGVGLLQMVPSTIKVVLKETPKMSWESGSIMKGLSLPLAIGAVLTAGSGRIINDYLYKHFGSNALLILFSCLVIFLGLKTLLGQVASKGQIIPFISKMQSVVALFFGMLTGVLSSLLGIGGAMIFRPFLVNFHKLPEEVSSKAIRFLLLITTLTGGLFYVFANGNFNFRIIILSLIVAFGGYFGFPIGVKTNRIVCKNGYAEFLQRSFVIISVIVLINTILTLFGFVIFSRYLMIFFAVVLFVSINLFSKYTKNNPKI